MKKTLSNKKLIELLNSRGIDTKGCSKIFIKNNYSNLIYKYLNPLLLEFDNSEIKLKEVERLYSMDMRIQSLIFSKLIIIEGDLRTILARETANIFGRIGHKRRSSYKINDKESLKLIRSIKKVDKNTIKKLKTNSIVENIEQHLYRNSLPIWFGVEEYEYGKVQKIIESISNDVSKKISSYFKLHKSHLISSINCMRIWRNEIAHKGVLFGFEKDMKISKKIEWFNDFNFTTQEIKKSTTNITSLFVILYIFLEFKEYKSLVNTIETLFKNHSNSQTYALNKNDLCKYFKMNVKIFDELNLMKNRKVARYEKN